MIFKVSDLLEKLNEIRADGMEYVDLSFMDADEDLPAALHFDAFRASDFDSEDYDEVNTVIPPCK